jgi:hypothetical protein
MYKAHETVIPDLDAGTNAKALNFERALDHRR